MDTKKDEIGVLLYDWALEHVTGGRKNGSIEERNKGLFMLLCVWNYRHFNKFNLKINLKDFNQVLGECDFKYFDDKQFERANFDEDTLKEKVKDIYEKLSAIEEIRYVGATKIMHLMCPDFFMMWDTAIRKKYSDEFELKLGTSKESYWRFIKKMQELYKEGRYFIKLNNSEGVPRAIDIWNVENITKKKKNDKS